DTQAATRVDSGQGIQVGRVEREGQVPDVGGDPGAAAGISAVAGRADQVKGVRGGVGNGEDAVGRGVATDAADEHDLAVHQVTAGGGDLDRRCSGGAGDAAGGADERDVDQVGTRGNRRRGVDVA